MVASTPLKGKYGLRARELSEVSMKIAENLSELLGYFDYETAFYALESQNN